VNLSIAFPTSECDNGAIRLVSETNSESEGTVELCIGEVWAGTICDDGWDSMDAAVVCRQLGFGGEGQSY
jgi:hypothetical protein